MRVGFQNLSICLISDIVLLFGLVPDVFTSEKIIKKNLKMAHVNGFLNYHSLKTGMCISIFFSASIENVINEQQTKQNKTGEFLKHKLSSDAAVKNYS